MRRSLIALAAACAATALAGAAPTAAAPEAAKGYGGGLAPASVPTRNAVFASARIGDDRRTVRLVVTLNARCSRNYVTEHRFAVTGTLGPDDRLRLSAPTLNYRYAIRSTGVRGRAAVDLGFAGENASGTVRFTASFRARGHRIVCDATLPVELRSANQDMSPAARPVAGASYYGKGTSRGSDVEDRGAPVSVALRVSDDGRRVGAALLGLPMRCRPSGYDDFLPNFTPSATIRPDGSFSKREVFRIRFRGGSRLRTTVRYSGRFTEQGARGTYRATSVQTVRGRRPVACSSGVLSFAAVR